MSLDLSHDLIKHNSETYLGINRLIRSIGKSNESVQADIAAVLDRYNRELDNLAQKRIDRKEFNRRTRIENLRRDTVAVRIRCIGEGERNHSMLEAFAHGDQISLASFAKELPFAFKAMDRWLAENKAEILLSECHVLMPEILVHGSFDAYIKTSSGLGVYDLKRRANVFIEHRLQVAFYRHCSICLDKEENVLEYAPEFAAVLCFKDGELVSVPVPTTEHLVEIVKLYRRVHDEKRLVSK